MKTAYASYQLTEFDEIPRHVHKQDKRLQFLFLGTQLSISLEKSCIRALSPTSLNSISYVLRKELFLSLQKQTEIAHSSGNIRYCASWSTPKQGNVSFLINTARISIFF